MNNAANVPSERDETAHPWAAPPRGALHTPTAISAVIVITGQLRAVAFCFLVARAVAAAPSTTPDNATLDNATLTTPAPSIDHGWRARVRDLPFELPDAVYRFDENLRITLDLSSRLSTSTREGQFSAENFLGLDLHKVISGVGSDWGTLRLQPYADRVDDQRQHDWRLQFRFFDFNFTRLARNRVNLRVGHFEIPYGLEQLIDTNGTLRDFIHVRNLGVKADWGASLNGVFPRFDYEVALTRGSGNDYSDRGNRFIVAGRIGTPGDADVIVGLSGFHGRVAVPNSTTAPDGIDMAIVSRTRLGADGQIFLGRAGILADVSFGRDDSRDIANGLLELNWHTGSERFGPYFQARYFSQRSTAGWDVEAQGLVGAQYNPDTHWSLSAQYQHDVVTFDAAPRAGVMSFQVRYRL